MHIEQMINIGSNVEMMCVHSEALRASTDAAIGVDQFLFFISCEISAHDHLLRLLAKRIAISSWLFLRFGPNIRILLFSHPTSQATFAKCKLNEQVFFSSYCFALKYGRSFSSRCHFFHSC